MNRTVNCIYMLTYLKSGRIYKISEIASMLKRDTGEEVNVRNIIEYRKELEYAGYQIITVPGKYGGYQLDDSNLFPVLKLSEEEKKTLLETYQYVNAKSDFMNKVELDKVMGKIFSTFQNKNQYERYLSIEKNPLVMKEQELLERYNFINNCIKEKKQIEIEYNLLEGNKKYILHPYKLFLYDNAWHFFALNPLESDVKIYKLSRVLTYNKLDKKFVVWKNFNPRNYLDEYGFKKDVEWHHLELIASRRSARLFKEKVFGKNQVIQDLEDGKVHVSLDMQNEDAIVSLILGQGAEVKVIEPSWVIDKIKEITNKIKNLY